MLVDLNIKDVLNQLILLQNQMLIEKKLPIFLKKIRPTILPEDVIFSNNNAFKTSFEYDEFMEMFMVEKVKDISFTIKCVQVFCKHKDLPFSLTECFC